MYEIGTCHSSGMSLTLKETETPLQQKYNGRIYSKSLHHYQTVKIKNVTHVEFLDLFLAVL